MTHLVKIMTQSGEMPSHAGLYRNIWEYNMPHQPNMIKDALGEFQYVGAQNAAETFVWSVHQR